MASQETGILFAEFCVRAARPGVGRIAIILPNGYLGNRSERYLALRRWLLCTTKVVAVVGFPRFTFKRSGADVSASVVIMEKRATPLVHPRIPKITQSILTC
jgi:type I restriction enzyme M protein